MELAILDDLPLGRGTCGVAYGGFGGYDAMVVQYGDLGWV